MESKMLAFVTKGQRFALTEKGDFPITLVEFHGWNERESEAVPGAMVMMMVFTCDLGIKQEMRANTRVWILEPEEAEDFGELADDRFDESYAVESEERRVTWAYAIDDDFPDGWIYV